MSEHEHSEFRQLFVNAELHEYPRILTNSALPEVLGWLPRPKLGVIAW